MKAKLNIVKQETNSVFSFFFEPEKLLSFIPGQYIYLTLPQVSNDPRGNMRQFTISSTPKEDLLQITTEIHPNSPFKMCLSSLKLNDEAEIDGPMGTMILTKPSKYTFIAAGLGITPFRSMIESYKGNPKYKLYLHHFVDTKNQELFASEKNSWKAYKNISVQNLKSTTFDETLIKRMKNEIFICGSPKMVRELFKDLLDMGIDENLITTEKFTGY